MPVPGLLVLAADEAFMARHKHMEVAERARYESVLGAPLPALNECACLVMSTRVGAWLHGWVARLC